MIKSMTSFGRGSSEEGSKGQFTVEIKSVNHRYLDINIRMPKSIIALEEEVRKMINDKLSRGKVDVFINYKTYSKSEGIAKLNMDLAKSYLECLLQIEETLQVKNDISVSQIARFPEVITVVEEEESIEVMWEEIKPLIQNSLDMMLAMRTVEGQKLKEDILNKLELIKVLVGKIETVADSIPKQYKKKLEERLTQLLEAVDIDESRIALEVAVLSDKAAVDEEITRLYSHIEQVITTLNSKEPIGRKLDFIMQEMNREANTIASKSSDIDMTNNVIEIKNLLEKIREQVQNIE